MPYKDKEKLKAYQRRWARARYHRRRDAFITSRGSKCANCDDTTGPFHVDHVERHTKVSHRVWSWSKENREAELAKCQLLCELCHLEKTVAENRGVTPKWVLN